MDSSFFNFTVFVLPEGESDQPKGRGANAKGLLVVYAAEAAQTSQLDAFLGKVLQAVQYDLHQDAYTIHKTPQETLSLTNWIEAEGFKHVLLFGIQTTALDLTFSLTPYKPMMEHNCTFMLADDLSDIYWERQEGGKEKSVKLWTMLKNEFLA